jgi:hypothetical protein
MDAPIIGARIRAQADPGAVDNLVTKTQKPKEMI